MRRQSNPYEKGRPGEVWVRWLYQSRGWYVMTTADYSGKDDNKAPSLLSDRVRLVVPDLLVFRKGRALWIEVKDFARPTLTRKTKTLDHGIKQRLAMDYQQVQHITGIPCVLAICEKSGGVVLMAKISSLMRECRFSSMNGANMVFWERGQFKVMAPYDRDKAKRMVE